MVSREIGREGMKATGQLPGKGSWAGGSQGQVSLLGKPLGIAPLGIPPFSHLWSLRQVPLAVFEFRLLGTLKLVMWKHREKGTG